MTDRVSSHDPRGQQSEPSDRPELLPGQFDLHAEVEPVPPGEQETRVMPRVYVQPPEDGFDHDADTELEDDLPRGKPGEGQGGDDDPNPPAGAGMALVIRAPSGPLPVKPGYTIAAVAISTDDEGEEQFVSFAFLTAQKMRNSGMAIGLASYKAMHPRRLPIPGATHVVVNDETGAEVFRRAVQTAA